MQMLTPEELQTHYLKKLSQIEEEMDSCLRMMKTLENLLQVGREGATAEIIKQQMEEIIKQQVVLIHEMDGLMLRIANVI